MEIIVSVFLVLLLLFCFSLFKELQNEKEMIVRKNLIQYIKSKIIRITVSAGIIAILVTNKDKVDCVYLFRILSRTFLYTVFVLIIYILLFVLIKKKNILKK